MASNQIKKEQWDEVRKHSEARQERLKWFIKYNKTYKQRFEEFHKKLIKLFPSTNQRLEDAFNLTFGGKSEESCADIYNKEIVVELIIGHFLFKPVNEMLFGEKILNHNPISKLIEEYKDLNKV